MSALSPTSEQLQVLGLFATGQSMVIEAGAGTGKTSTLVMLAEQAEADGKRGRYMAFNRAIVEDVQGRVPTTCAASTAHSMAFRSVGKPFAHRLNSARMQSWVLAQFLGIDPFVISYGTQRKILQPGKLASLAMRAVVTFCHTADERPTRKHVPYVDGIDIPDGRGRTYANNAELAAYLEPMLGAAWLDLSNPQGQLPFRHDHYLKLWQLSNPRTQADYILFDEAQDANPVMAAVIAAQEHAQRVYVGDSQQAIYEFTGAVNAMADFAADNRRMLTQSFRFGDAIADVANDVLADLASPMRLCGLSSIASTVGPIDTDEADAVLCRTNAKAMQVVLMAQQRGRRAHLVGGGKELASFARAARSLQEGKPTYHPDLACFESWGEVQTYVESDPQGDELALLVELVDKFGVEVILGALEGMPREAGCDLLVSTAHKAKGREWGVVKLADDFTSFGPDDPSDGELRLRYVACTRAKQHLDHTALQPRKDSADDKEMSDEF